MGLALLGLLEARPGVRSVAKHILMLDLDGRGRDRRSNDNTEYTEDQIGVNDTADIICNDTGQDTGADYSIDIIWRSTYTLSR